MKERRKEEDRMESKTKETETNTIVLENSVVICPKHRKRC